MRWLLLLLLLLPGLARAQGAASLVADTVTVTPDNRLVAEGNVEAFYDGTRLSATQVAYDEATDRLTIIGPIFIETPEGDIFTAKRADLDPQLENGILRGARLVLDRQLQLAANRIDRVGGRYTQLYRTSATACRVCGGREPLWELRAERVVLDEVEDQLWFENTQLRIGGLPVAWLPVVRLPGPGVERATGLLVPSIRQTDRLGTGIRLPYFVVLSPSRDLTLTPYLSPQTRTLEILYRQAYLRGDLSVEGAITQDTIRDNSIRSYVFADASFAYPGNWRLEGQLRSVSDEAYLVDYDYSDRDRLDSFLEISRIRENDRLSFGLTVVESLRAGDRNAELPSILPGASYSRVLRYPGLPGRLTVGASADAAIRESNEPSVGRDTGRLSGRIAWQVNRVVGPGLVTEAAVGLRADAYLVENDPAFDGTITRTLPYARAELRWPLQRTGATGVVQIVEPVVALAWSDLRGGPVPNEDSQVVELDEANLLSFSRFPGEDARETGWRAAGALRYQLTAPSGFAMRGTLGRLVREEADPRFSDGTGLEGTTSDWLLSWGLDLPSGLTLNGRGLFDDGFDFSRSEARLGWDSDRIDIAATYVQLDAAPDEGRPDPVAEWTLDAAYRVNQVWTVSGEARYDLSADEPQSGELGLEYRNECVTVGLSVSRRFTSSTTLEPETDYGLSVAFNGFSVDAPAGPIRRTCRN
ncbi:LPS-assembly protein LptD [Histidinibacterium aquaticum]|uniref:LPS-assembly protein LptD n=1 Tax=Histidinibacterium aquaticum TaxID=2613962 RepID=A0A5J5GPB1_9RHOB|nr:LPS assembly protein LptD [Histidinibacterium aquaticum]KAA9009374.1 LPS-assembly protein LptD [Histidinibacterium aquaticum]